MSELLTTGQMIDRLKVGEVAIDKLGNKIFMEKDNSLRTLPNEEIVTMTDFTVLSKWRILPNYVSFEEAMKALKNGYTVIFHQDGKEFQVKPGEASMCRISSYEIGVHGLITLYDGEWTIEGESK